MDRPQLLMTGSSCVDANVRGRLSGRRPVCRLSCGDGSSSRGGPQAASRRRRRLAASECRAAGPAACDSAVSGTFGFTNWT
jgi:hypothetical protein